MRSGEHALPDCMQAHMAHSWGACWQRMGDSRECSSTYRRCMTPLALCLVDAHTLDNPGGLTACSTVAQMPQGRHDII